MASEVVCRECGAGPLIRIGLGDVDEPHDEALAHPFQPGIVCPECEGSGGWTHRTRWTHDLSSNPHHRSCRRCSGEGYIPVPEEGADGL